MYQRPWSLFGAMTKSVPSDDWCRVESRTPMMTSRGVSLRMTFSARFHRKRSKTTGLNSRASTVRYSMTHQATSNMTEWWLPQTSGCQMR